MGAHSNTHCSPFLSENMLQYNTRIFPGLVYMLFSLIQVIWSIETACETITTL